MREININFLSGSEEDRDLSPDSSIDLLCDREKCVIVSSDILQRGPTSLRNI